MRISNKTDNRVALAIVWVGLLLMFGINQPDTKLYLMTQDTETVQTVGMSSKPSEACKKTSEELDPEPVYHELPFLSATLKLGAPDVSSLINGCACTCYAPSCLVADRCGNNWHVAEFLPLASESCPLWLRLNVFLS